MSTSNELKIELFSEKEPLFTFDKKQVNSIIEKNVLDHSLDPNQNLAYIYSNVPLLMLFIKIILIFIQ